MRYRRCREAGGTWFFTVNLANRHSSLLVDRVATLRTAVRLVMARHPFIVDAWVILPDHMHAVWTLPPDDSDYSTRWMLIKSGFSRHIPCAEPIVDARATKRERGVWQQRFWEHQIRDEVDFKRHVDYIHYNPVKHGLTRRPIDWPWSSIHRAVRQGQLTADWASEKPLFGPEGEADPD